MDGSSSTLTLFERIRSALLDGRLSDDFPLTEANLSGQFGVSRTPIREALARLEQEGLVERWHRGYRIRSGTTIDVLEIYEVRISLEQTAAAAAALNRSALQLGQLEHLHGAFEAAPDPVERRERDSRWHRVVWEASGNETLRQILEHLTARLRIQDQTRPTLADADENHAEHAATLEAIRVRDADAAADAMRRHLQRTRDLRLNAFARATLP